MRLYQIIYGLSFACLCLLFTPVIGLASSSAAPSTHSQYVTKLSVVNAQTFRDLRAITTPITAQKVIDAVTFLGTDNQIYRLAGIDIPNPENDDGARAIDALRELIEGKPLRGYMSKKDTKGRTNRMGQIIIHATTKNNVWVQGYLIENGLARVATTISNAEQSENMLAIEQQARAAGIGIWAKDETRVISSDEALNRLNSFQIVEGVVTSVATIRNQMYLNFGIRGQSDWRKDFTIGISPALRKSLTRKKINTMEMQNARVRVRGWVQNYNGPYIELTHPEQLELLSKGSALPQGAIETPQIPAIATPKIEKPTVNSNE
jgi:micrococcal nuclease